MLASRVAGQGPGVAVVAGVPQRPRQPGQPPRQPGAAVLGLGERVGAESGQLGGGVLPAALAAADLLDGPVAVDGGVGQQPEGPGPAPAEVGAVAGLVDGADVAGEDQATLDACAAPGRSRTG